MNSFVNSIHNQSWFAAGWFSEKQNLQSYHRQSKITWWGNSVWWVPCWMKSQVIQCICIIPDNTIYFPKQKAWLIVQDNGWICGSCSEAALPALIFRGCLLRTENKFLPNVRQGSSNSDLFCHSQSHFPCASLCLLFLGQLLSMYTLSLLVP